MEVLIANVVYGDKLQEGQKKPRDAKLRHYRGQGQLNSVDKRLPFRLQHDL